MIIKGMVQDLVQQSRKWTDETRASMCTSALRQIAEEFAGEDAYALRDFIFCLLRVGVSGDHVCSQAELKLYRKVINPKISADEFFALTNHGDGLEFVTAIDEVVDSFDTDAKFACCTFILCFLSADHKVTKEEEELIIRLFQ